MLKWDAVNTLFFPQEKFSVAVKMKRQRWLMIPGSKLHLVKTTQFRYFISILVGFFCSFYFDWSYLYSLVISCTLPAESYHMKEFPVHTVTESSKVEDFCDSDNHTIDFKGSPPLEPYASPRAPYFPFCPVLTLFPLYHVLPLVPRTSPNATVLLLPHRTSPRAPFLPSCPRSSPCAPALFLMRYECLHFIYSSQLHFFFALVKLWNDLSQACK